MAIGDEGNVKWVDVSFLSKYVPCIIAHPSELFQPSTAQLLGTDTNNRAFEVLRLLLLSLNT